MILSSVFLYYFVAIKAVFCVLVVVFVGFHLGYHSVVVWFVVLFSRIAPVFGHVFSIIVF
jgi:hypothetical protein